MPMPKQASTDELTGLPNRRWFHRHLRAAIADADDAGGELAPLAEQAGLMAPLTKLVLDQALDQAARWHASGFDLTMAINVSATNLLDGRFTDAALAALIRVELRPESLVMEITENVIMADPERSLQVVGRLSDAGVQVALDDFGTG
jgi:EAL domain-containing protein (putative c-di-GMP-specific phosphodiesterase class I)